MRKILVIKYIDPFMLNATLTLRTGPFHKGCPVSFILPCCIEIPVSNANSVDPDQTPQNAASDLCLHCLPMSLLWDARHK